MLSQLNWGVLKMGESLNYLRKKLICQREMRHGRNRQKLQKAIQLIIEVETGEEEKLLFKDLEPGDTFMIDRDIKYCNDGEFMKIQETTNGENVVKLKGAKPGWIDEGTPVKMTQ